MDSICRWIDRQHTVILPVKRAYETLKLDLPTHATIAWLHHVNLWTINEIAIALHLSDRTVIRYLGVANLRIMAAIEQSSGTKTGRTSAKKLRTTAEYLEALQWQRGAESPELSPDEAALAGEEPKKSA